MIKMSFGKNNIKMFNRKLKAQTYKDWAFPFLQRVGQFVRRAAMQSMPRRKRVSSVGEPPHSHLGRYKKSIRYFVERSTRSVIIGPMAAKVGEALEFGGSSFGDEGIVNIRPRPHMRPALEKGIKDIQKKSRDPLPKVWY